MQGVVVRTALSAEEVGAIRELATVCEGHDGIELKLNWDMLKTRPGERTDDFLYYEAGRLVGFFALYHFNSWEIEISGMVHPDHRRKGIFTALYAAAKEEIARRGEPNLIWIVSEGSQSGKAWALSTGASYKNSEYKMEREKDAPLPEATDKLLIREATLQDAPELGRMTHVCFGLPLDEMVKSVERKFGKEEYTLLVAEVDGVRIGRMNVDHPEAGVVWIFGFCVLPEYQGKGYGREFLARTIRDYAAKGYQEFALEVAVENKGALGLYESCGYRVTSGIDYYEIDGKQVGK